MILNFFFLFALSLSTLVRAQDLPRHCYGPSVRTLQTEDLTYRYGLTVREDPEAPLIIFIPGGPGQTSMNMPLAYPYHFSVMRTDPRGMGCNENINIPKENLSSEMIAKDIFKAIKAVAPKRYFLHGISHGTIVATILAKLIENEGFPEPEAVILEGTIGRPFRPNEYAQGTVQRWKEVKAKLPPKILTSLKKKIPFNFSSKDFAAWLSGALIFGVLPSGFDYAQDELLALDEGAPENLREGLQLRIKLMSAAPSQAKIRLYKEITCREFAPDVRDVKYDYDFKDGELVLSNDQLCKDIPFDRAFDSKDYQFKAPVIYVSGDLDPATPASHALYHFEHHQGPAKHITVKTGGHAALSNNLTDCFNDFWFGLLSGRGPEFGGCSLKTVVRHK